MSAQKPSLQSSSSQRPFFRSLFESSISDKERLFFTRHLSTMLKAGIPLSEALAVLEEQARSKSFRRILGEVKAAVRNGSSLEEALADHPRAFGSFFIQLVRVSERSGTLEENLEFLSQQLKNAYALRAKIRSALLYPSLVFLVATLMGGAIALFILPQLVDFFDAFDFPLPISTKILLFVAEQMKARGVLIIGGLIAFAFALLAVLNSRPFRSSYHRLILRIPVFGKLIWYNQLAQATRTFGVLLKSGLNVTESLEVTGQTLSNLRFQDAFMKLTTAMESGEQIASGLKELGYREFPELVTKMIAVGERSGRLDESLLYLSEFYEDEIDELSRNLSTLLEPVLLLGIGLLVAFTALAIISPIYQLTGSIGRS